MKLFLIILASGLLALSTGGCKGPQQPSLYTDYTHLDYDGQTGGAARVGFNIPLGTGGFREPSHDARTLAQQQLAALLALVEATHAAADPGDLGAPAPAAGPPGPAGPGLHVEPQAAAEDDDEHLNVSSVTDAREELEAWSWRTVGMLAVLGLVALSLWALYKATGKYLKD